MHTTGIIAEYNPLHLGHQFHIAETKKETGADYVVVVLSGDFVQRGTPAILDKYTRARMALEAGADLVLELPTPYALSSGEGFGFGGVSLLHELGCINSISFGTEEGALDKLIAIAKVLISETPAYQAAYQSALKQGLTHPAARTQALAMTYPELDLSVLEGQSNNMLALEYCKAIYRLNSDIQPVTIKRQGQKYLENALDNIQDRMSFASATAIRAFLNKSEKQAAFTLSDVTKNVPPYVAQKLLQALSENRLLFLDDFSNMLHYKLLSLSREELLTFWEVTPDFANKIEKNLRNFVSFSQFANLLWTKDTTYAKVCRTLTHILLDIKKNTWDVHTKAPFARILGFRKDSAPLLSELKKEADIPLISKLADAKKILTPEAYQLLNLDMKASHIYDSVVLQKSGIKMSHEMQKQIIIL